METCELKVHLCVLANLIFQPPGGRLVYSTCSLNPIENEAVVQAALLRFGPELSLLPAEDVLPPGCPRGSPGLEDWFVPDPSFESTAVVHHELGSHLPAPLEASMFATGRPLHLRRCARFWPIHGPYFGGFFLAAFAKTASAPTKPLVSSGFTPHFVNVAETAPDTGLDYENCLKAPKYQMFSPLALPVEVQYISRTFATLRLLESQTPIMSISVCLKLH